MSISYAIYIVNKRISKLQVKAHGIKVVLSQAFCVYIEYRFHASECDVMINIMISQYLNFRI